MRVTIAFNLDDRFDKKKYEQYLHSNTIQDDLERLLIYIHTMKSDAEKVGDSKTVENFEKLIDVIVQIRIKNKVNY